MTKLLEEILRDLEKIKLPNKFSFGGPLRPTDKVLHKLTDGQKKLWLLLVQTKKEQARLDLQIRHTEFEFMDVPEPPLIIEGLKDQYARASIKRHAVNVILFASLGYEFENLRKSNDQNTFREGGLIVMEKKLPSPPTAVLLIHVEEDPQ